MSYNRYRGVDLYALSCIRYQAKRLTETHPCFTRDDYEDIEQELVLYFLMEAPKFNPEKSSWNLHISMIIKKRALWLGVQAERQKRGGRIRPLSLSGAISSDGDSPEPFDLTESVLSEDGLWGDTFWASRPDQVDVQTDVQKVIQALPPRLRQVCEWLEEGNPSEISRKTGIPRTTINSAIVTLRQALRTAGLENYFPHVSSTSERTTKPTGERSRNEETPHE